MRITESQLRRIVRQEILRESMGPMDVRGLEASVGRRLELLAPVSAWVNELGRKVEVLPRGAIVSLHAVRPTHRVPNIARGSTALADRLASESPYNVVVLEVEVQHGGESGPEGTRLGRGDMARITVMPDEVRPV